MFLEKIFERLALRRSSSNTNDNDNAVAPPSRSPTTFVGPASATAAAATRGRFLFGRSDTRILDDGPSSMKEVMVRKLPLDDNDDDDDFFCDPQQQQQQHQQPPRQQPSQEMPPSPEAPVKTRRLDGLVASGEWDQA